MAGVAWFIFRFGGEVIARMGGVVTLSLFGRVETGFWALLLRDSLKVNLGRRGHLPRRGRSRGIMRIKQRGFARSMPYFSPYCPI